jgi:DNA-binding HxlR family transcriptional regulator
VSRKAIATVPVTVEYAVTPLGRSLAAPMDALRIWAETHMEEVIANQQRHDAGAAAG